METRFLVLARVHVKFIGVRAMPLCVLWNHKKTVCLPQQEGPLEDIHGMRDL